ncbi:MAG: DUF4384 domain-containing protein [Deltaproteobacteria bacterium]|nr:DUF4384 domain-containing protein [Deltaproteobacteria bacterium]
MRKLLTALFFFWMAAVSYAGEKPVMVEADGEAYLGEIDTQKEAMGRARADAQSKAVEKALGVFIKAHTIVSNSQLAEDLVYASVRGKIQKTEIIAEGWDKTDRSLYRVKLRALIEPVYPERGEGLSARLSLSKTDVREGDEVQIFYQVSRDSYVYIFSIAADGSVTLLLPNALIPDNFAKAGTTYHFPPPDSRIHLNAMFLPAYKNTSAEEKIKIIATKQKEDILPLGFKEGVFQVYDTKSTGMISDLVRRLGQIELTDWTEATAVYHLKR